MTAIYIFPGYYLSQCSENNRVQWRLIPGCQPLIFFIGHKQHTCLAVRLPKLSYIDTGASIIDDTGGSQSGSEYSSAGRPASEEGIIKA